MSDSLNCPDEDGDDVLEVAEEEVVAGVVLVVVWVEVVKYVVEELLLTEEDVG